MKEGDSVKVASYTAHGFSDTGALIKISDGQNFNYLEKIDLTNTYNLKMTLREGERIKSIGVMIQNNKDNVSIWLIGPSAAGKTTVSKLLYDEIKEKMNLVIIDGDQVRNLYENNLGYDKNSRSKNTKRYINLVNWLSNFNISSIVAVISPFEKDRDYCRKEIKNYIEIYLKAPELKELKETKKKLYEPAIKGEKMSLMLIFLMKIQKIVI